MDYTFYQPRTALAVQFIAIQLDQLVVDSNLIKKGLVLLKCSIEAKGFLVAGRAYASVSYRYTL